MVNERQEMSLVGAIKPWRNIIRTLLETRNPVKETKKGMMMVMDRYGAPSRTM